MVIALERKAPTSIWDKEIEIRVKPRYFAKWGLFVALLVIAFFLGRCTAEPSQPTAHVVEAVDNSTSFFDSLKGFIVGLTVTEEEPKVNATANVSQLQPSKENVTTAVANSTSAAAAPATAAAEESTEPVVTKYTNKVALSISDVKIQWLQTWGKIVQIKYTAKNNEAGTVESSYFILNVEGYPDFNKKVPIPLSMQKIKAGIIQSEWVTVPSGFAYNNVTAGSLDTVDLTLQMYDSANVVMASAKRDVDLRPPS